MISLFRISFSEAAIVFLFTLIASASYAQSEVKKKYEFNLGDWSDGSVQVNDGTIIKGQIRYNWLENIVTVKNDSGQRTFNAQGVYRFEMDGPSGKRYFISSPKELTSDKKDTYYFFEILVECKHFAFMMLRNAHAEGGGTYATSHGLATARREVVVEKLIYFFDDEGNINLYWSSTEVEVMGVAGFFSGKKPTGKVVDKALMGRYLGDLYPEAKEYAKKNGLSFWDRNDLVSILTYFKKLESN